MTEPAEGVIRAAQAAGLGIALAEFFDDVVAAAEQAERLKHALQRPTDPAAEPWPPIPIASQ